MRDLLKRLELKHADMLIAERMLRNSDTSHPVNARNLEQVRSQIKSLQIQIDMIDVLRAVEKEFSKERIDPNAPEKIYPDRRSRSVTETVGTQRCHSYGGGNRLAFVYHPFPEDG